MFMLIGLKRHVEGYEVRGWVSATGLWNSNEIRRIVICKLNMRCPSKIKDYISFWSFWAISTVEFIDDLRRKFWWASKDIQHEHYTDCRKLIGGGRLERSFFKKAGMMLQKMTYIRHLKKSLMCYICWWYQYIFKE